MCGIAGFFIPNHSPMAKAQMFEVANSMATCLSHRGPDDGGVWLDAENGISLSHRRLSILDLSASGHQPMMSHCERYVLCFNGEIYNHSELKKELDKNEQINWRGHSDTEVLLELIARWGLSHTLERLNGMFAFALWDRSSHKLFLVRDRFGEKPLYYARLGNEWVFASELKSLKRYPAWQGTIDSESLALLMQLGYIPAPRSIYKDVYKLPAGHYKEIGLSSDCSISKSYWHPVACAVECISNSCSYSDEEAVNLLESTLADSIRMRMKTDVPFGAFLSGGIDSSLIVALMQAQSDTAVKTFSIGFEEQGFNESLHAREVAKYLGTEHVEFEVNHKEALDCIPILPEVYDEPFADASQLPTILLSRLARNHVTVCLSGDGGDELFAGYNRYVYGDMLWRKMSLLPKFARKMAGLGISSISPKFWDGLNLKLQPILNKGVVKGRLGEKLHKLAKLAESESDEEMYRYLMSRWKYPEQVVNNHGTVSGHELALGSNLNHLHFIEKAMLIDTGTYLPDDILVKVDRASMAASLEARVPLLDHRLFELAWRFPRKFKIRNGQGKWALREALYRHLPKHFVDRPKQGFDIPLANWLRGPLREWGESLLDKKKITEAGMLNGNEVRQKWEQHVSGKKNWHDELWPVLMFQLWLEAR